MAVKRTALLRACLALILGAAACAAAAGSNPGDRGHEGMLHGVAAAQRAVTGHAPADAAPQSDISYLPVWLFALALAPYGVFVYVIRKNDRDKLAGATSGPFQSNVWCRFDRGEKSCSCDSAEDFSRWSK